MNNLISSVQQRYYAWDLSHKKSTGDDSKFTGILSEAKVDLNPHQIDAALFAFKSPLSKGAILADEVGLGKTIEAGIILSEFWAEHKRNIIIVVPASLRNQWSIELLEKFHLPSLILDGNNYKEIKKKGKDPFEGGGNIIICSYNFAVTYENELSLKKWDLVVLDEAHKLRNVYKRENLVGNSIKRTFQGYKKILLTATPLQNNLKELYGLISIIDPHFFSSVDTFDKQYNKISTRDNARFGELKGRLKHIIHRTLRNQVKEYVNYTRRTAFVQKYDPSNREIELYERINSYLFRSGTYGIPDNIRPMLSLIIRKIMSSSAYALSYTLERIIKRLEDYKISGNFESALTIIKTDFEVSDEEKEEIEITDKVTDETYGDIDEEIAELKSYQKLALSIESETKAQKLLIALDKTFKKNEKLGASRKALIFTESRKTQEYLMSFLQNNGYKDKVVCFNGTNNDEESKSIYRKWLIRNHDTNIFSGSEIIDRKQSLIDYFRTDAEIMIATESGAEGVNLQFCSLVVNYDMPWNPQRIEQRIGRCHRYGQKFDVIVVNFVNQLNLADCRVYELLNEKFNLFDGVFGSSDEVLGSLESGLDFEHKLNSIYQNCRTEREIAAAFDQLQSELEEVIKMRITQTKKSFIENFDEEVVNKLKIRQSKDNERISSYNRQLWLLAKNILGNNISEIDEISKTFCLKESLNEMIPAGTYILNKDAYNYHQLRVSHPLGEYVLNTALNKCIDDSFVLFTTDKMNMRHVLLEQYKGYSGAAIAYKINVNNKYDGQEHIIFSALTEDGEILPDEFVVKLMSSNFVCEEKIRIDEKTEQKLNLNFSTKLKNFEIDTTEKTEEYVRYEIDKYEAWSEDQVYKLESEVISLRKEHELLKKQIRKIRDVRVKLNLIEEEKKLSRLLRQKQSKLFEMQDECDDKVEKMTAKLWASMENNFDISVMFRFKWKLI